MTKYIYNSHKKDGSNYIYHSEEWEYDYLQHFELPFKVKLPKMPKLDLPKMPDLSGIAKEGKKLSKKASKAISDILPGDKKKKDREWKKHKWKDRKRDKNGKWIYDYGDGFPGEKKKKKGDKGAFPLSDVMKETDSRGVTDELIPLDWGSLLNDPELLGSDKKRGGDPVSRFIAAAKNFYDMSNPTKAIEAGRNFVNDITSIGKRRKAKEAKQNSKLDPKTGLRLKNKQTSADDDLIKTNPNYNTSGGAGNSNCYACALAYDLRRRGYEVTAPLDNDGGYAGTVLQCYKGGEPKYVLSEEPKEAHKVGHNTALTREANKAFDSEPDNTRGLALLKWDNGTTVNGGGGHVVAYEKHNGKTMLYDAQTGEKVPVSDYVDEAISFMYMRTDNLDVNYDKMKNIVDY